MVIRLLAIIATSLLMYWRTLKYEYVMDDTDAIGRHKARAKDYKPNLWKDLWDEARGNFYFSKKREHAISIFFHTLNCILIYFLFGRTELSFVAALLFCINPANNQGAIWLSAKPYSVASSMVMIGYIFPFLFPIMYAFTYFWSANTILSPLIFLFIGFKYNWSYVLLLPAMFFCFNKRVVPVIEERHKLCPEEMQKIYWRKIILALKTYGYYFKFAIFPTSMGLCHEYLHTFGMSKEETEPWYKLDRYFFLGIAVVSMIPIGIFFKCNMIGLIWFTLFIAQWTNVLTINHLIAERYLYLSNIGLMFFLAQVLGKINSEFLMVALLTYYATRLWYFMPAYKNYIEFFKSNVENFPKVAMAYNQYGLGLVQYGNGGSGLDVWIRGVQERPQDFRLNFNIANLFMNIQQPANAVQFIRKAEAALDKKNNYEMWKTRIDEMKRCCKENGIDVDKIVDTTATITT